jgi:tRNA dimethylallyltransferase
MDYRSGETVDPLFSSAKTSSGNWYREVIQHLQDKLEWGEMVEEIQKRTRQYAKRQMTWFRKENNIGWHKSDDIDEIFDKIKVYLEK